MLVVDSYITLRMILKIFELSVRKKNTFKDGLSVNSASYAKLQHGCGNYGLMYYKADG